MDPLVITITETAETLRISERLVYALIAEGLIPVVRLGSRKVVPLEGLRRMVEQRTEWDPAASPGVRFADTRPSEPEVAR